MPGSQKTLVLAILLAGSALACITTPSGRRQLALVSETQLEAQAAALYEQMRTEQPVSKDERLTNYVLCVSNAITSTLPSSAPSRWEVTLFEDESANAFALPGAKIGVHTGLLAVAKNQHQLAAVIGHEIAHVLERHSSARASNQMAAGLIIAGTTTAAGAATDMDEAEAAALGQALGMGAQFGALLPFSRSHESIADEVGLDFMASAGFDPRESVALWRNMAAASQGAPPEFASTHPSHATRIQDLQQRIPGAMTLYERAREVGRRPDCK